jgi:hypothetical protein
MPNLKTKTLIIANTAETFRESTLRMRTPEAREHQMLFDQNLGERGLFWAGDNKLVVTSQPVPKEFLRHVQTGMGYRHLEVRWPADPTLCLSRDVWEDTALFKDLVAYCGHDPVNLIPYTTTAEFLELAERLREAGAKIELPESVERKMLWLRDYLDTKAGFRALGQSLARQLNVLRVAPGFVCRDRLAAAQVAAWFLERGESCVVKADQGAGGEGLSVFKPEFDQGKTLQDILEVLDANPYLDNDLLVAEQFVAADVSVGGGSPSPDLYVPPPGKGEVELSCLSAQTLAENGEFIGVEIHPDVLPEKLTLALRQDSLTIAHVMREMGYVGPFDIDFVIGQDGQVYMVEFNMRRTGGSHGHDAATYLFGKDYTQRAVVLTANKPVAEAGPISFDTLYESLHDLFYPMGHRQAGLILTNVSLLKYGSFGYILLAPDLEQAYALRTEMSQRIQDLIAAKHQAELLPA